MKGSLATGSGKAGGRDHKHSFLHAGRLPAAQGRGNRGKGLSPADIRVVMQVRRRGIPPLTTPYPVRQVSASCRTVRLFGRSRKGQAVVEFSLILPVLVLLVLGLVQLGQVISLMLTLQIGASEGARLAITGATNSAITTRVDDVVNDVSPSHLGVSVTPASGRQTGQEVSVAVSYSDPILFGELASLWGASIPLSATVTMEMQ